MSILSKKAFMKIMFGKKTTYPDVVFDAAYKSTYGGGEGVTSRTWNHTVGIGDNRAIIVFITTRSSPYPTAFSASINGIPMDLLDTYNNTIINMVFIAKNPPVGANTVVVSWTNAVHAIGSSVSFFNVDQEKQIGAVIKSSNIGTSPIATIPSRRGNMIVDILTYGTAGTLQVCTPSTSQLKEWEHNDYWNLYSTGSIKNATDFSDMSWTISGDMSWTHIAISVQKKNSLDPPWLEIPLDLLMPSPIDPANKIAAFINQYSGVKIRFPSGVTFSLENMVSLSGMHNVTVDFNNCIFIYPNATPLKAAVMISDVTDCNFLNLIVDGNRANNVGTNTFGIILQRNTNVNYRNIIVHDSTSHGISIDSTLQVNVNFYDLIVYDCIPWDESSEIYTEASIGSTVSFFNTTVYRTEMIGNQVFYLNSFGETTINGLNVYDIDGWVFDIRRGTINISNVIANHCGGGVACSGIDAYVVIDNYILTNMEGRPGVEGIVYVIACAGFTLSNLSSEWMLSGNHSYGIRIDRSGAAGTLNNVSMNNINLRNYSWMGFYLDNLDESCYFENIELSASLPDGIVVYCSNLVTAQQFFTNIVASEPNGGNTDPNGMLVIT